jgi:hypothetical protein
MTLRLKRVPLRLALLVSISVALITCGRTERQLTGDDNNDRGGVGASQAGSPGEPAGSFRIDVTCTLSERKFGFVECNEGWDHRPLAVACEISGGATGGGTAGEGPVNQRELPRVAGAIPCDQNPEICDQFQWGRCEGDEGSYCASGCEVDADCGPAGLCVCSGASATGGQCWKALCHTDADCPASLCADAFGYGGLACLTERDECVTNADCRDTNCRWDDARQARVCTNQP